MAAGNLRKISPIAKKGATDPEELKVREPVEAESAKAREARIRKSKEAILKVAEEDVSNSGIKQFTIPNFNAKKFRQISLQVMEAVDEFLLTPVDEVGTLASQSGQSAPQTGSAVVTVLEFSLLVGGIVTEFAVDAYQERRAGSKPLIKSLFAGYGEEVYNECARVLVENKDLIKVAMSKYSVESEAIVAEAMGKVVAAEWQKRIHIGLQNSADDLFKGKYKVKLNMPKKIFDLEPIAYEEVKVLEEPPEVKAPLIMRPWNWLYERVEATWKNPTYKLILSTWGIYAFAYMAVTVLATMFFPALVLVPLMEWGIPAIIPGIYLLLRGAQNLRNRMKGPAKETPVKTKEEKVLKKQIKLDKELVAQYSYVGRYGNEKLNKVNEKARELNLALEKREAGAEAEVRAEAKTKLDQIVERIQKPRARWRGLFAWINGFIFTTFYLGIAIGLAQVIFPAIAVAAIAFAIAIPVIGMIMGGLHAKHAIKEAGKGNREVAEVLSDKKEDIVVMNLLLVEMTHSDALMHENSKELKLLISKFEKLLKKHPELREKLIGKGDLRKLSALSKPTPMPDFDDMDFFTTGKGQELVGERRWIFAKKFFKRFREFIRGTFSGGDMFFKLLAVAAALTGVGLATFIAPVAAGLFLGFAIGVPVIIGLLRASKEYHLSTQRKRDTYMLKGINVRKEAVKQKTEVRNQETLILNAAIKKVKAAINEIVPGEETIADKTIADKTIAPGSRVDIQSAEVIKELKELQLEAGQKEVTPPVQKGEQAPEEVKKAETTPTKKIPEIKKEPKKDDEEGEGEGEGEKGPPKGPGF